MKVVLSIILAALILIGFTLGLSTQIHIFSYWDFVQYWSTGSINLHQGNPYDPDTLLAVERGVGFETEDPVIMYNPPWTLSFGMLMALLPYPISRASFFVGTLMIIMLCAKLGWEQYNVEERYQWVPLIAIFTFYGVLHLFIFGQVTSLVILGICLFLHLSKKRQDFWAGFFASLILIKPHVIYLILVLGILWILQEKRFKVFYGFILGIILQSLIPVLVNPNLFQDYSYFLINNSIRDWAPATLTTPLRVISGGKWFGIQFLPSIMGSLWGIWYWYRNRHAWDWGAQSPLILLVSLATAAYGWIFDHTVIYLAIIQIAAELTATRPWKRAHWIGLTAYSALNVFVILTNRFQHELWWVSTASLIIYLCFDRVFGLRKCRIQVPGSKPEETKVF